MYKHGSDGQIHQSYSDEEDATFDHEDLSKLTDNIQTLNLGQHSSTNPTIDSRSSSSLASSSRASSPFSNTMPTNFHRHHPLQTIDDSRFHDWNDQGNQFWSEQQQLIMSDVLFQEGNC